MLQPDPSATFRLLIVEDRPEDAEILVAELVRSGFAPRWNRVDTAESLVDGLYPAPALILCDDSLPGLDALAVLGTLHELALDVPVIVVSSELDEESCVKSLRMGAVDYLLKDRLTRLGPAVEHALANRRLQIEKRDAERKERETASILRALVVNSPAAISVKAVDGRYLLSNRQFEQLCAPATGDLLGQIDADLFPAEQARKMTELDARCLHNSMVVEREETVRAGAEVRHLLSVRYPVIDDDEKVFGIGAIYLDITRQKQIELELREARIDMLSRAEQLAAGNQHLREQDRMKTDLITTVSHELRAPLTSIRGYLEMLRDEDVDLAAELGRRFLDIIDRNSEHLLDLIDDLMILSRMDSPTYPDRDVPIREIVDAAAAIVRPAASRAQLSIGVFVDDDLPPVAGDRDQLERALVNLLSNAVKYSPEPQSPVTLDVSGRDDGLYLVIADHGIGIEDADQPQLFTRFFRAESARERGIPGTGLGLAVVKGIVEAHGGTVRLESTAGEGTTVTVQLPSSHHQMS
jgi:PAS domain S-box-containing protein